LHFAHTRTIATKPVPFSAPLPVYLLFFPGFHSFSLMSETSVRSFEQNKKLHERFLPRFSLVGFRLQCVSVAPGSSEHLSNFPPPSEPPVRLAIQTDSFPAFTFYPALVFLSPCSPPMFPNSMEILSFDPHLLIVCCFIFKCLVQCPQPPSAPYESGPPLPDHWFNVPTLFSRNPPRFTFS